jgi:hypothetical protein
MVEYQELLHSVLGVEAIYDKKGNRIEWQEEI